MSEETPMGKLTARVVSDGNGGLKIKESPLETLRKWLSPAILALLAWVGKGLIAEVIALHDSQIRFEQQLGAATSLAQEAKSIGQANSDAIKDVDRKVSDLRRHR